MGRSVVTGLVAGVLCGCIFGGLYSLLLLPAAIAIYGFHKIQVHEASGGGFLVDMIVKGGGALLFVEAVKEVVKTSDRTDLGIFIISLSLGLMTGFALARRILSKWFLMSLLVAAIPLLIAGVYLNTVPLALPLSAGIGWAVGLAVGVRVPLSQLSGIPSPRVIPVPRFWTPLRWIGKVPAVVGVLTSLATFIVILANWSGLPPAVQLPVGVAGALVMGIAAMVTARFTTPQAPSFEPSPTDEPEQPPRPRAG